MGERWGFPPSHNLFHWINVKIMILLRVFLKILAQFFHSTTKNRYAPPPQFIFSEKMEISLMLFRHVHLVLDVVSHSLICPLKEARSRSSVKWDRSNAKNNKLICPEFWFITLQCGDCDVHFLPYPSCRKIKPYWVSVKSILCEINRHRHTCLSNLVLMLRVLKPRYVASIYWRSTTYI